MRDERRSSPVPQGRAWVLNRLAYRAFTNRWFWLVLGLLVGGCGAFIALAAHLAHYQPITGTLASYSSADNTLQLAGQPTTYQFYNAGEFHPALPAQLPSGTRVTIWVLPGYSGIDALQILDPRGAVQAQYTDDFFDHPAFHLQQDRLFGGGFGVLGGLVVIASLVGPPLARRQHSQAAGAHQGRWMVAHHNRLRPARPAARQTKERVPLPGRLAAIMAAIFVVGALVLAPAAWNQYEYWQIDVSGIRTQATVTQAVPCGSSDTKIGVRYTTQQGSAVDTRPDLCFGERYTVGERITIWYRPADPARVVPAAEYRTSSFWGFVVGLVLVVGLCLAALDILRIWWRDRRVQQRRPA